MDAFMSKMYEDLLLELKAGKDAYVNFIEDEKEKLRKTIFTVYMKMRNYLKI